MELNMDIVYGRIKTAVKECGMNLVQMSEKTGISINTIKNWGQGTEASVSNLITIAHALDVSLDYLVGNTNDRQSHKSGPARAVEALERVRAAVDMAVEQEIDKAKGKR